jgi:rhodanese-related sulfurtransferase
MLKHICIILVTAICAGTAANFLSPNRLAWSQDWSTRMETLATKAGLNVVSLEQVRVHVDTGSAMILDARSLDLYGQGHIPGAFSCPADDMQHAYPDVASMLIPDLPVLVYCAGKECEDSMTLGKRLLQDGFTNVLIYVGGYAEWSSAAPEGTP